MKKTAALMIASAALVATTAGAHHSTAGIYEQTLEVELKGKVKEWRFINPHPSLKIEVVDEKGVAHEWDVSYGGSAVAHLKRRGYGPTTFKAGDVIIVKGHPTILKDAYGLLMETGNPKHEDGKPYP